MNSARAISLGALGVGLLVGTVVPSAQEPKLLADSIRDLAKQISATVTKEQKKKIAVVPFRETNGRTTELSSYIAEELVSDLFAAGNLEIVERTMLEKVFAELKLNASGAIDPQTAKQVGKLAGVDAIVTGTITELQSYIAVNCRMIDSQTGSVFAAAQTRVVRDDDVKKIMGVALGTNPPARQLPDSTTGSTSASSSAATSNSPSLSPPPRVTAKGFTFELQACRRTNAAVTCSLLVTSNQISLRGSNSPGAVQAMILGRGDPSYLAILGTGRQSGRVPTGTGAGNASRAYDVSGNEYVAQRVRLGNSEDVYQASDYVPKGDRARAVLWFDDIPGDLDRFDALDIGAGASGEPFRVEIKNVPIVK